MDPSKLSLNSLWLLISRLGTQAGMAVFTILLARGLGSMLFGEYAFIASVVIIGNVLTTFGTDMLLIREIAATDRLDQLFSALLIQLVLSAVFILVVFVGSAYLHLEDSSASAALQIYSLSMLPLAFYTVFTTALRGRQHMLAYAFLNSGLIVMQILAALWLLRLGGKLVELAILLVAVQIGGALLAGVLCARQFPDFMGAWKTPLHSVLPLVQASAPIAMLGILGVIYQRFSILLLPLLAGATATGWFSAGARVVEAAKIGHMAVFTAMYPSMAQVRGSGQRDWLAGFRFPALFLLAGALLAAILLNVLSGILIPLLFGAQYNLSVPLMRILAWMLIPFTFNNFFTIALLARREEVAIARALVLSILALITLTAWWVPILGAAGAAWAALCAETIQSLIFVLSDARNGRILRSMIAAKSTT
jgi:O-antigen/teichoic acid export membrane protein